MQESPSKPHVEFPIRVPIKVIGHAAQLDPEVLERAMGEALGAQPERDHTHNHGRYVSYTFWITLPDEHAEAPLRRAIQAVPGVVTQL